MEIKFRDNWVTHQAALQFILGIHCYFVTSPHRSLLGSTRSATNSRQNYGHLSTQLRLPSEPEPDAEQLIALASACFPIYQLTKEHIDFPAIRAPLLRLHKNCVANPIASTNRPCLSSYSGGPAPTGVDPVNQLLQQSTAPIHLPRSSEAHYSPISTSFGRFDLLYSTMQPSDQIAFLSHVGSVSQTSHSIGVTDPGFGNRDVPANTPSSLGTKFSWPEQMSASSLGQGSSMRISSLPYNSTESESIGDTPASFPSYEPSGGNSLGSKPPSLQSPGLTRSSPVGSLESKRRRLLPKPNELDLSFMTLPDSAAFQQRTQQRSASQIERRNRKKDTRVSEQAQRIKGANTGQSGFSGAQASFPSSLEASRPSLGTAMRHLEGQQSYASNFSGSRQLSNLSRHSRILSQAADEDMNPCLLGPRPARPWKKADLQLLDPYGSPETIREYPPAFQEALRPRVDQSSIERLKDKYPEPLFVYGSLMIPELSHDVSVPYPDESIFLDPVVKHNMCPASVRGYRRLAIHKSDNYQSEEPIMVNSTSGKGPVHGMLIFGLRDEHIRILDRYLLQWFVKEEVQARINVMAMEGILDITARAYVWPRGNAQDTINHGVELTVERFWEESEVCRLWRLWDADKKKKEAERTAQNAVARQEPDRSSMSSSSRYL